MTEATVVTSGDRFHAVAADAPTGARAPVDVTHDNPSRVSHNGEGMFAGLPDDIRVGRYHSLAVERSAIPDCLIETASTDDDRDVVMAVRHEQKPHVGVQFHPESVLTKRGKEMVQNFLNICQRWGQ